jgi:phosphatidylglycerol lysyltransferase
MGMLAAPVTVMGARRWRSAGMLMVAGRAGLALLLALAALANIAVALVTRPLPQAIFMEQVVDLDGVGWGREGVIVVGVCLLLVARALVRGKRHAWWLSVLLMAFSVASAAASHTHRAYLAVAFALLLALVLLAPLFPTRSDPLALRRGYLALAASVALFVFHGTLRALWHNPLPLHPGAMLHVGAEPRRAVFFLLRLLLFLVLGYGVAAILRPVLSARRLQRDEHARARAVVAAHGSGTAAHFALASDKSYFWSATGASLLAYRLIHGVALALADPIGPEEEHEGLLLAFLAYCRRQDWAPAFYLAGPTTRRRCRDWGLAAYKIGEEGLLDVASFSTAGKAGAAVRHAITRAGKDGVTVRCYQGEAIPEPMFAALRRISAAWLGSHGAGGQMGFSMGRFPADWSRELLTAVACDAGGEAQAFLTWTPLFAGNGWSLDVMRRLKETTPGTMELLIAESIAWARERGSARMSLGLAPLAGLDTQLARDLEQAAGCERADTPAAEARSRLERSAAFLYRSRLLLANYASLYAFKTKFRPAWEPRYLVVADPRALPRVLLALMHAQGTSWWAMARGTLVPATARMRRRTRRDAAPAPPIPDSASASAVPTPASAASPAS